MEKRMESRCKVAEAPRRADGARRLQTAGLVTERRERPKGSDVLKSPTVAQDLRLLQHIALRVSLEDGRDLLEHPEIYLFSQERGL